MKPDATARKHFIAEISYQRDRLECSCGEVMAAANGSAWRDHRNRVGLKTLTVGQTIGRRLKPVETLARAPLGTAPRDGFCGMVLRNRHGEWRCAILLSPGASMHAGQHAGVTAIAARHQMRARSAPGSVRPIVAGRGRPPTAVIDPEPVPEWRQGPGDTQAGTVASAKRLGTARSDRGDALTAEAPARVTVVVRVSRDVFEWVAADPRFKPAE